jgi:hypothetical protein
VAIEIRRFERLVLGACITPHMRIGYESRAELTWTEHCPVPSSGRIAAMSWIPPVCVEPIPPLLDDMAPRMKKDLLS